MLAQGKDPFILDEAGHFEEGDGLRASLYPHHLVIEMKTPERSAHMVIDLTQILNAIAEMTREMGS